jgi:hypothetical protein
VTDVRIETELKIGRVNAVSAEAGEPTANGKS